MTEAGLKLGDVTPDDDVRGFWRKRGGEGSEVEGGTVTSWSPSCLNSSIDMNECAQLDVALTSPTTCCVCKGAPADGDVHSDAMDVTTTAGDVTATDVTCDDDVTCGSQLVIVWRTQRVQVGACLVSNSSNCCLYFRKAFTSYLSWVASHSSWRLS